MEALEMNTCWKCGRTLPGSETECDGDCGSSATNDAAMQAMLNSLRNRVKLDWAKVKTADDLLLVMSVIFNEVSLARDSREAHFLKRYLKDDSTPGAETNPS